MKIALIILAMCLLVLSNVQAAQIQLDHVIIAVHDIDQAVETYRNLGFTIRPGRLHLNGLVNAHIKFSNGTEIELMSVLQTPLDDIARRYADFLKSGDGGAYIAFSGISKHDTIKKLKNLNMEYQITTGVLWDYITFYGEPGFEHLFFIYPRHAKDTEDSFTRHQNGSSYINGIWLEATAKIRNFLVAFDAVPCSDVSDAITPAGDAYRLGDTMLIVIPPRYSHGHPRILGLGFSSGRFNDTIEAHGVWIKRQSNITCASVSHKKLLETQASLPAD